ncbi:MAG: nucleoside-diphosphate kinase [Candidatus Doudnabacteria bacterium RIFCSPHIGHO2_12_FULL_48_11]|uniref:nucleoside-diphosphate kinase n=1 Tax=Candidatus Doudnabacteria bacterium RIFCSPHIGHO2_01_FULL_46_24 TaxID=1817825 RepID=A0A1F5NWK8_9BACT|nr:MAG: nucleoside-diphosphate kinase [Candidatus Doudnabacteria bacterium RIFCSPHIGHO2_01_FULL_46_24]OGE95547.1 MAG: nucleoside-diphosphate kinase [Candidatus Doudnabacteria bacterium RIFCSPHIGHO2_12_FULL_48_11]
MPKQHPREEMTFVMIKPDGVRRGLVGEVMRRIEQAGLKIIALEMYTPTREEIDNHYPKDEGWITRLGHKTLSTYEKYGFDPMEEMGKNKAEEIGPDVRNWLIDYMSSGPVVKMVVQGVHAVDMVRKLAGNTQPALAEMGTIRGDYSVDSAASANKDKRAIHNLIHASETAEEAKHEIEHWGMKKKLHSYKRVEEDLMI